jgi:hypothetical protein
MAASHELLDLTGAAFTVSEIQDQPTAVDLTACSPSSEHGTHSPFCWSQFWSERKNVTHDARAIILNFVALIMPYVFRRALPIKR